MFDTQLSDFQTFDYNSIIFYRPKPVISSSSSREEEEEETGEEDHSEIREGKIPHPSSSFQNCLKIKIAVKNSDGTVGDLIFSTPSFLYSFGIQEIMNSDGEVVGYRMPISMWKKRVPTEEENTFQSVLQTIIDLAKECVEEHLQHSVDIKKFSPLSLPKEMPDGEVKSPILFTKLIYNKQEDKILTLFMDDYKDEEISPLSIISKHCYVTGAIKIESIFIGDKVTIQIKLYEALIRLAHPPRKLLLKPMLTKNIHSSQKKEKKNDSS